MSLKVWLPLNNNSIENQGIWSSAVFANNGATLSDNGKLGKCYSFNGTSSRISNLTSYSYSYPISCACWIKPASITSTTQYIISINQNNTGFDGHIIGIGFVSQKLSAFTGGNYSAYDTALSNNVWYHVAVTIDADKNWVFYLNGVNVKSGTCGNAPAANWLTIGARSDSSSGGSGGAAYFYTGLINDVRIYDHVLSLKEIKDLSRGLVAHYPLNNNGEGGINICPDTSSKEVQYTYPASSYKDQFSKTTTIVPSASKYTLSFYAKSTVNGDQVRAHYYNPNTTTTCESSQGIVKTASDGNMDFTLSTEWKRYWVTYTQTETTSAKRIIFPRMFSQSYSGTGGTNTGTVSVRCVKMEEGDHPTAWNDGSSQTTVYDVSGNKYHMTRSGNVTISGDTVRYSKSMYFSGGNYLSSSELLTEIKSISVWFKTTKNKATSQMIVYVKNSKLCASLYNNCIISYLRDSSAGAGSKCTIGSSYIENGWNHLVVISTGTNTRDVYINGVKQTATSNDYWSASVDGVYIGTRMTSTPLNFYGYISDVRLYATPLSEEDILDLYQNSAHLDNKGNLTAYEFIEG